MVDPERPRQVGDEDDARFERRDEQRLSALVVTRDLASELAGYGNAGTGGQSRVRLLQDTAIPLAGLDVLLVEDVVDTGLTLNYLCKLLALRNPASLRVATLLDRPYRRLVADLPVDYVGFTVPDEFFVGYGFDIDEQWRNLPDLRLAKV